MNATATRRARAGPCRSTAGQDLQRLQVVERRDRLEERGVRPQRAQDLEHVAGEDDREPDPQRRRQTIDRRRSRQRDPGQRGEQEDGVDGEQDQVPSVEPAQVPVRRRTGERARQLRDRRDDREREDREQQRQEHRAPGDRARQQHLERPALALAGDRRRREAHRVGDLEGDRERMRRAQRDGAVEAERIGTEQPQEGVGDDPRLHDRLHLPAERRVDHGHQERPDRQRQRDQRHPGALRPPRVAQQGQAQQPRHRRRPGGIRRRGSGIVRRGRRLTCIQLEEGVLEAGGLDGQVVDRRDVEGGQERARISLERAAQPPVAHGQLADARHGRQVRRGASKPQLDPPLAPRQQASDVLERDQPARAHDRDPVAHALDLGQDVRREEHGPAGLPDAVQDVVERALHQRVQPLGRLVEDRRAPDRAGAPGRCRSSGASPASTRGSAGAGSGPTAPVDRTAPRAARAPDPTARPGIRGGGRR